MRKDEIMDKNGNRIIQYLMRSNDYSEEYNEWLTLNQLKNAPRFLRNWQRTKEPRQTSVPLREHLMIAKDNEVDPEK